ncbi:UNVERIFIED_CONTAM: hypothetical protein Sangu_2796500 [Sesamum angustifolium]|uniref:Reverse transcriptase zinc-binding domain-containing protein n=1 Tax=Sesamum angustifolium TaxID=2727405 RepID=A0AAW2ISJ2_9LAMI
MSWEQVSLPKESDELGIQSGELMNKGLICKLLWAVENKEEGSVWVKWILRHQIKDQTIWIVNTIIGSWGRKKIIELLDSMLPAMDCVISDGKNIKMWLDPWHAMGVLDTLLNIAGGQDRVRWHSSNGCFCITSGLDLSQATPRIVSWTSLLHGLYKIHRNLFLLWLIIKQRISPYTKTCP